MKFYEVQNVEGDYIAVIFAKDQENAASTYSKEISDEQLDTIREVPIDELYNKLLKANGTDKEHDYAAFGVMGRLQAIISSNVPTIVLTQGVDW